MNIKNLNLSYKDVSLISRQISTVRSRDDIKINVELMPGLVLTTPIISSPMVDVTDAYIAQIMHKMGGISILHRFQSIEEQCSQYKNVSWMECECICAVGLDDFDRIDALYVNGCRYFCLDVANGANVRTGEFLVQSKRMFPNIFWMVGNVMSKEQFIWCQDLPNVYSVRVGVAGGSPCTTKKATGLYHGMISLLGEISTYNHIGVTVVADGGINRPADYSKSLIFGADAVILGSVVAACNEAPSKWTDGNKKIFHGSASRENQLLYKDNPKYVEGEKILLEPRGDLEDVINEFNQGLRSSMSYFNATDLSIYRQNLDFKVNVNE